MANSPLARASSLISAMRLSFVIETGYTSGSPKRPETAATISGFCTLLEPTTLANE